MFGLLSWGDVKGLRRTLASMTPSVPRPKSQARRELGDLLAPDKTTA